MDSRNKNKKIVRRRKKRRFRTWVVVTFWLLMIAIIIGLAFFVLPIINVKNNVTVEAGEKVPDVSEFLRWNDENAKLIFENSEEVDLNTVADYKVIVQIKNRKMHSKLHVKDTIAPVVVTKDASIFIDGKVSAEDFIEQIDDKTKVKTSFKKKPDTSKEGMQKVTIVVVDEGDNKTEATANLEVLTDTEPPVISGVKELTVAAGSSISYKKGVTVTDNIDENVTLQIDTSKVNLNEIGDYPVVYYAVDAANNKAEVKSVVHVKQPSASTATEDTVNAEADKILASITNNSMSQYEKAQAIYNWCHEKIAYADGTPKSDWVKGAYYGLVERRGDCYAYAMAAKCLLTRAGIENMDVVKIPTNTSHFWSIINLGEGWYHFDTCRWKDGSKFFYVTDETLMAYSNAHQGSHNYDASLYPTIQ